VVTRPGAAGAVARHAPYTLDYFEPARFRAASTTDPVVLRDRVSGSLARLFLSLSGVCLLIGAFGIANTSLVGVLERVPEIGMRRALGARRRDVGVQFLVEAAILGALGGVLGAAAGLGAVLLVAILNAWTPVVSVSLVMVTPCLGLAVGVLAGIFPAYRAASIEPVQALNH